eukprot:GHVL01020122.1.p1 GENE.GHVL01020122.1~~GHVL01020122.1.p1  ORF type:complete len:211 (+),score=16.25 GHVL01020122.1:94-726(+)
MADTKKQEKALKIGITVISVIALVFMITALSTSHWRVAKLSDFLFNNFARRQKEFFFGLIDQGSVYESNCTTEFAFDNRDCATYAGDCKCTYLYRVHTENRKAGVACIVTYFLSIIQLFCGLIIMWKDKFDIASVMYLLSVIFQVITLAVWGAYSGRSHTSAPPLFNGFYAYDPNKDVPLGYSSILAIIALIFTFICMLVNIAKHAKNKK